MNKVTTPTLDEAVEAVRKLPEEAQSAIADEMIRRAAWHRELNEKLAEAEARLDAGEGIPAEDVIAELRERQKRYEV